jgi:uncharacterized protein
MEMKGERVVPAPTELVWNALNSPEVLKLCIPGCESIEPDGENAFRMAMATKVGPVSARFTGKVRLSDIEPPSGYTIRFEGSGGVAGFVNGEARVSLVPISSAETQLLYAAKAQVGGKLAQVGSRLIDGAAQKLTGDFFNRFVTSLTPTMEMPVPVPVTKPRTTVPLPVQSRVGRRTTIMAAAVLVALAVVYLLVRRA